jgi:hypothetical protein
MAPRAREVRLPQIYQSKASFSLTISLPLSEKVKVLDLIRKKLYDEAKTYSKNKCLSMKL